MTRPPRSPSPPRPKVDGASGRLPPGSKMGGASGRLPPAPALDGATGRLPPAPALDGAGGRLRYRPELAVFAVALVGLLLGARGGPGWGASSANAVIAIGLDRSATAPLYGLLATVAAWLPFGEAGFRLAILDAGLAALLLAGVVAATRALAPRHPGAGVIGAVLLAVSPPLHEAAGPGLVAACGTVWALAGALRSVRQRDARDATLALGGCAVALGGEPWLGVLLLIAVGGWLARFGVRRSVLALAVATTGALAVAWWGGADGALPGLAPDLGATVAASGRGAGAIVVGAGLLGAAFAAVTGLPGARGLLLVVAVAAVHAVLVAGEVRGMPLLGVLAVGAAVIPIAIVRAAAPDATGRRAVGVCAAAGLPLIAVALVAGAASWRPPTVADETGPTRAAHGLMDELPAGPGIVITTRETSWFALAYAVGVAGARPDLAVAPPIPPERADVVAVTAMRLHQVAGGDVAAVGRLDVALAQPRGRAFQMLLAPPTGPVAVVPPPASYGAATDPEREARAEALERARFEATNARLGHAARAIGLAHRFGAGDLAVLAGTRPSAERPALFDFVPALGTPPGAWQLDLFGDDLAWVGGLRLPELRPGDVAPRRLHALWCEVLAKKLERDDIRITALGPAAVAATTAMLAEVIPASAPSP